MLKMTDDLCCDCPLDEHSNYRDPVWEGKYILGIFVCRNPFRTGFLGDGLR